MASAWEKIKTGDVEFKDDAGNVTLVKNMDPIAIIAELRKLGFTPLFEHSEFLHDGKMDRAVRFQFAVHLQLHKYEREREAARVERERLEAEIQALELKAVIADSEDQDSETWNYPWWFFSLARFNPGGPTYYGETVRMAADLYFTRSIMGVIAAALTFLFVLAVILPIIKHRVSSVIVAVNSVCIGVVISLCLLSPEWLRGHVVIQSPMNYYSPKQYAMTLGIHIGLASTNITLRAVRIKIPIEVGDVNVMPENSTQAEIHYNEEILMFKPELFQPMMSAAIDRGLPIPLLSVIHFLTSATLGFTWSQDVMQAGYHSYWALVFAQGAWILAVLLVAAIPRYSCYAFIGTGFLMMAANLIYFCWVRAAAHFPPIYVAGQFIELRYGVCFWVCLAVGIWSFIYGFCFAVYDVMYPDIFLTIFDIDYDHKRALSAAHRLNRAPMTAAEANMSFHSQTRNRSRFVQKEERIPMQRV